MKKVAVILAGCGYLDGSEIRESVFTLLALDKYDAEVSVFAPDAPQHHVVSHLSGQEVQESRNVLAESARIARGDILELTTLDPVKFDCLILPGGFGAAKNLSNIAFAGEKGIPIEPIKRIILSFHKAKKPIGSICISPSIVASALQDVCTPSLTLGNNSTLLHDMKVNSVKCNTDDIVIDVENKLVSTPAYMHDDRISNVYKGIDKLVQKVLEIS
ncbi:MAG: isoprenoid biosynthesis glyoxalase ElbB [Alphaproteobacteria bacterium]|jgi:enhancing lycopene biosynthesis protein 2|nr:isoprenoid biosynthesis glyoxalase ElbB [Candidatus Jidaibacter sp.]